jgi:flagellar biosynthesis regulator FlaF
MPEPHGADRRDLSLRLPDHADVERAVLFVSRVWHRMVEVIASAQNQLLHWS